jgi:hypothetical protein
MSSKQIKIALCVLVAAVAAMGLYAYKLLQKEESTKKVEAQAIAPPVSGASEKTVLMIASDRTGKLQRQQIEAALPRDPGQRAQELIRLLMASYTGKNTEHRLASGADVREVFIVGGNLAVVDMNSAFGNSHPSGGKPEQLTLESMANTLVLNIPAIKRIKILIDGRESTPLPGHVNLREPLEVK